MKAMILGAGIGSRLDPLTRSLPKPLVPIVGTPVMGHLINLLKNYGVTEIMVNVQYLGDRIIETIGDGSAYGVTVHYSREDKLWGDAGGVKRVESFFRDGSGEPFLVVGGDDLTDTDIGRVVAAHKTSGAVATLGVTPVDDPSEYGIVVQDDNGFITRFQEKPKKGEAFSNLANTGIYVFSERVFDFIPEGTFFGFGNNVFPALMEANERMYAVPSDAYWKDVGNLAIYWQSQKDAMDGACAVTFPGERVGEKTWVHGTATVESGGEIVGPCVVCENARIAGSVGDYSVVGKGAVVEAGAVVKNSILWDGAVVKGGTYVENCVVGTGVSVASSHGLFNALAVESSRPGS